MVGVGLPDAPRETLRSPLVLDSKHGVAFAQGATVFADALALTVFDSEHSDFEERWFTLGTSNTGKLLAVSHTYTAPGPTRARLRIVSAREATRNERRQYQDEPR